MILTNSTRCHQFHKMSAPSLSLMPIWLGPSTKFDHSKAWSPFNPNLKKSTSKNDHLNPVHLILWSQQSRASSLKFYTNPTYLKLYTNLVRLIIWNSTTNLISGIEFAFYFLFYGIFIMKLYSMILYSDFWVLLYKTILFKLKIWRPHSLIKVMVFLNFIFIKHNPLTFLNAL